MFYLLQKDNIDPDAHGEQFAHYFKHDDDDDELFLWYG